VAGFVQAPLKITQKLLLGLLVVRNLLLQLLSPLHVATNST
jgi:hypothetical protein